MTFNFDCEGKGQLCSLVNEIVTHKSIYAAHGQLHYSNTDNDIWTLKLSESGQFIHQKY